MTLEGLINAQRFFMGQINARTDEEPASWVTINGNHIPLNEEGKAIGGNPMALGAGNGIKPKSRFGQGKKTTKKTELTPEQKRKNEQRAAAREKARKEQENATKPDTSYQITHRPPTLQDVENGEGSYSYDLSTIVPADVYEHPEWYFNMRDKADRESMEVVKRIKDDPDAVVTIYRGSPKGELNDGDWVTFSKTYAEQYAGDGQYSSEGSTVHKFRVKASDLTWAGDSINEFGYRGEALNE